MINMKYDTPEDPFIQKLKSDVSNIPTTKKQVLELCKQVELKLTFRKVVTDRDPESKSADPLYKANNNKTFEHIVWDPVFEQFHYLKNQLPWGM